MLPIDPATASMIAIAIGAALAVMLIVGAVLSLRFRDAGINARLQRLDAEFFASMDSGDLAMENVKAGKDLSERLNSAINERSFAQRISRALEQANLPFTVAEWLLISIAIPLVLTLGALVIWRDLLLVPFTLGVGIAAPILWLRMMRNRRSTLFGDQLAETLNLLVSALRGGFSLNQALAMVAREAQEPTKSELGRVVQEMQLGLPLGETLDNLCARINVQDLDLVVSAIKVNARVGGNLTEILETISTTIRERYKLRRDVEVITSMQRISAFVIGGLPFALAVIIYTINPEYMGRLFQPGIFLCIPIGAFAMAVAGFLVIRRIADIRV